MSIYTLDIAKWRCGGQKPQLGYGSTQMANRAGFMCCLGQFAQKHTKQHHKFTYNTPRALAYGISKIYDPVFVLQLEKQHRFVDTELASDLIRINDSGLTSVDYKVNAIRELLRKNGHILRVRNKHLIPKEVY